MTREELIAKLSTIRICVVDITYTYDIGLTFNIMTPKGVISEDGYNVGMWPCLKLPITDKTRELQAKLINGDHISDSQMLEYQFCKDICTFRGIFEEHVVGGEALEKALMLIRNQLPHIDCRKDTCFAYVSLYDWNTVIVLSSTYDEFYDVFLKQWEYDYYSWEEMDDDQLEVWYAAAESENWDCLPYTDLTKENDNRKDNDRGAEQ